MNKKLDNKSIAYIISFFWWLSNERASAWKYANNRITYAFIAQEAVATV